MASTMPAAPAGGLEQQVDLLSPQAKKLWAAYQSAASTLGESLRDLGFVDLVVYGRQTTGKSSLLGALTGLQLPTGDNQITKCPVRIAVSPTQKGYTLTAAGNPPLPLDSPVVTADMYKQALDQLSRGRVTHQEMTVSLGAVDHPPLNLVDLPGLIPNTSDASSGDVEEMVKDTLQNPATLPIIVLRAESDELATVRTELTGGKKFYAVATHLDLYDPERDVGRLVDLAGSFKEIGCLGLFLVSVKGSQDKSEAWYDEFCSRCPDGGLRTRLRAMCGVGSLRAELQAVQLNHMLRNLPAITANLSRLHHQVAAKINAAPRDEEALHAALHQALGQTGQDLSDAVERGSWSVGSDEAAAHAKYRLQERAHQVLRDFAARAEEQVLQALTTGWKNIDPEFVMTSSQLSSEQQMAHNLLRPGLVKLRMEAEAASVRLLALQKSFLMWRAEKHLGHLGALVLHAFGLFVDEYHAQKHAALSQILDHADEAFKVVPPEVYAPALYHALLESTATTDSVKRFSKPLAAALEENQPLSTGHQPKYYEDGFAQHWTKLQRKSKLLAFERSSETINSLSGQMWMIIFTRSCRYMTMQPWQTSLAYAPLQPAFVRWVEIEGHDLKAWVDPEQETLAAERAGLAAILAELKPFEMNAATLSQAPVKLPKKEPSSRASKPAPKAPADTSAAAPQSTPAASPDLGAYSNGTKSYTPAQNGGSNGYINIGSKDEAPRTPPQDNTTRTLDAEPSSPWGGQGAEAYSSFSSPSEFGAPQTDRKKSLGAGNLMGKFRASVSGRSKSRDLGQDKLSTAEL